jgi:hypothetical protein
MSDRAMIGPAPTARRAGGRLWPIGAVSGASAGALALWQRIAPVFGPLMIVAFLAAILGYEALRPHFNWDMIAFLASALNDSTPDFSAVHATVYDTLRLVVPASEFRALTEGDAYRLRQFTDPAALQSMLAMYEVKWLYVTLLALAIPVFGMAGAGFAINVASAVLLAVSLWAWMSRHRLQMFAPVIIAVFIAMGGPEMVRGTGADMLTLALMTSGLMMWDRGRHFGAMLPLTLAVLARPDSAIFIGGFCVLLAVMRDAQALKGGLLMALATGAYMFATSASHHIGWWPHFWFSTYHIQDTLAGFEPVFSLRVYLTAIAFNLARSITESGWLAWTAVAGMISMRGLARGAHLSQVHPRLLLLTAAVIATLGKFMLFPLPDDRLYMPLLFPAFLLGVAWLWDDVRDAFDAPPR